MIKIRFIILNILVFGSCNQIRTTDIFLKELPDSLMINEVISTVIRIDSLDTNNCLNKKIRKITVFKQHQLYNDSIPSPPPPPFSVTFDKLFRCFNSDEDLIKRRNDSIFFALQTDTARKYQINNDSFLGFRNNTSTTFQFFNPVFSFDKQFVYVQYNRMHGEMMSDCHALVLGRDGNNWIKVDSWFCGEK